ncbi:MAG: 3-keto-disaccharide hydrolase [Acidobacteriaceae bacterium]
MKLYRIGFVALAMVFLFSGLALPENKQAPASRLPADSATVEPFLGRWDLTLYAPDREYPSWLELTEKSGQLQGRMVGRWGNAHPILNVKIQKSVLSFSSPKDEEDTPNNMPFQAKLVGGKLSGTMTGPDGTAWRWAGDRAPLLKPTTVAQWGKPIPLFDGKDTRGWWFDNPSAANIWTVKDGMLIGTAHGSNIITTRKFRDFKLHVEFNCKPDCNTGVYLRGRYEVQIADNARQDPPNRRTGSVYGFLAPSPEIPLNPGTWHAFDITLIGRTVTVVEDGQTVIDKQEIPGITGDALDSREGLPGPIYLQGAEPHGGTSFRNLVITPAKD